MIGQTLGAYRIEKELGRGGMGAVYTAVHTLLGRRAAVKVLLSELSQKQDLVQRFFNEARAATAIKHPSIVEIYDFGWAPDGSAYIVMELMTGEPLASRLRRLGPMPVPIALTVTRQVANALHAAHQAGIIHRDLKPDNVFLVPDPEVAGGERVKLLDFGIAKLTVDGQASQTSTGAVMGTPLYMSPEQCEGARLVDPRSDLYSLGCMLFEMIAGRVPFQSEGVGGLIGMHLFVPAPPLRSVVPDAPPEVEALVAKLLAKAPGERYQTAEELAAAVGRLGAASGAMMAAAPMPSYPGMAAAGSYPPSYPPSQASSYPPSYPPAHAGPSTTLSSAAGVAGAAPSLAGPPRGRRGRGLWLALGGVAVAGATVAIVLAAGAGGGGKQVAAATPTSDDAAVAAAPLDAAPTTIAPAADVDAGPTAVVVADVDAGARAVPPRAGKSAPPPIEPTPPVRPKPEPTTGPLPAPKPEPTTGPPKLPRPSTPEPTTPATAATADELHDQAKEAAYAGDFTKALTLCQRELKLRPGDPLARFNCGVFAYQLGKFDLALKYLDGLDNPKAAKMRERVLDEMRAQGGGGGGGY